jgi:hypothetical protein
MQQLARWALGRSGACDRALAVELGQSISLAGWRASAD